MTHVETRHAIHPDHARGMDTAQLRQHFLVEGLFAAGQIRLTYTHYDRFVVGGAVPDGAPLTWTPSTRPARPAFWTAARWASSISRAGPGGGRGQGWDMANGDVLYLGMGAGAVTFSGGGRFYITSAPAHRALPHR